MAKAEGLNTLVPGAPIQSGPLNQNFQILRNSVNTIDASQLAPSSVENSKLAGSISADKLAGGITGSKLAAGTITSDKLSSTSPNQAVAEGNIRDAAVTYSKIKFGEVYGSTSDNITRHIAAGTIGTADLRDGAVTSMKIAELAVTTPRIADSAVTEVKVASNAVSESKIKNLAVTTAKIGDLQVTSTKIADNAVSTAKIGDQQVTSTKIADSAVLAAKLANNAVESRTIADGAVTSAKIGQGQVATGNLADGCVVESKLENNLLKKINDMHYDTGWLTSGEITALAGWSVGMFAIRRVGKVVSVTMEFTRTGSEINVPTNGNITNHDVALVSSQFRPSVAQGLSGYWTGPVASGNIAPDGKISLNAVSGGTILDTGRSFSLSGVYLI